MRFAGWVEKHISHSTVFTSHDGSDASFKLRNAPPHVLVTEWELPKVSGFDLVRSALDTGGEFELSVIVLSPAPDQEHFVDDVVRGKVQFLPSVDAAKEESGFNDCLMKALNRLSLSKDNEYRLHFLSPGQVLFSEGDKAVSVFIVKRGKMQAYKGAASAAVALGDIQAGEFVGEMAHINNEPRSASVKALEDCELIEIPAGSLDVVLFSKPAWAHALMKTLSKRLKRSNETLAKLNG